MPVAVVDEDESERSQRLLRVLAAIDAVKIHDEASADAAAARVRRGDLVAYVRIPPGYGDPDSVGAALEIGHDPSRSTESAVVHSIVSEAERVADAFEAPAGIRAGTETDASLAVLAAPALGGPSIVPVTGSHRRSGMEMVFGAALLWGLMGCSAVFAISMVSERTAGTLLRLRAAPVSWSAVLGGKALACFIACCVDCLVLVILGAVFMDVHVTGVAPLAAAVAAAAFCFSGLTMALSVVGHSEQAVAGAGWSVLIVLAMLGGAMVPLSLMPESLQSLSVLSPVRWGIVALEGALWRGLSWSELMRPVAALLCMGALAFGGGVVRMGRVASA